MSLRHAFNELRQKWQPDSAVAFCLRALDQCDAVFDEEPMWPVLKRHIRPAFSSRSAARQRYVTDEDKAARVVFSIVAEIAGRFASSGENHIYRGVLSQRGRSFKDIAEIAIHELHEADWIDYEERDEQHLEQLNSAIESAG